MSSSPLVLAVPRFLWRSRWFWAAWLLVFLLPLTREEARLHFIGSRYFPELYGQPWQERWGVEDEANTPNLSPLERSVWLRARSQGYWDYSSSSKDPSSTEAGRLFQKFPREKWLHSLAVHQSLGWGSLNTAGKDSLIKWCQEGEGLDPQNAIYPLVLAKVFGDSGQKSERTEALERAASCTRYDDGTTKIKQAALGAALKTDVRTWSEKWYVWSRAGRDWNVSNTQLNTLLSQLLVLSQIDMATARKSKSSAPINAALKRSNAMMRVSLLLQSEPCNADKWRAGAQWARTAWRTARNPKNYFAPPEPTVAEFTAFARAQGDASNIALAQKCAARMRLLAPFLRSSAGLPSGAMFSTFGAMWAEVGHALGFGVMAFGAYLLVWWWLLSLVSWRAMGRESTRVHRLVPSISVISCALLAFAMLTLWVIRWVEAPAYVRRGPPVGEGEVSVAFGLFAFFSPPLLLALWWAVQTVRKHRDALALPARAQLEMNLAPLDAFVLSRALGAFALCVVALSVGLSLLWGYLRWQGLVGYDWLRFMWPKVSIYVVSPEYTSFDAQFTPSYCAVGVIVIAILWLWLWRYSTDPARRPIYHDALRGWKEAVGCTLTLSVWVYLALLVVCHFSGEAFSHRLDVAAQRGEGAFVSGF